jgi:uncharacterized protein (TIGR03083 family)
MTHFDEELAPLLALDALTAAEQADAEVRIGSFPAPLSDATAALAEAAELAPPDDLRAAALSGALRRRAAGRPVDAATACSPAEGFRRTVDDLFRLINGLSEAEWDSPAHDEHGTVRELMSHLVGIERLSARWLDPDDDVPPMLDHVAATRDVVADLAAAAPARIAEQWRAAARAVAAAAAAGDPSRAVVFHDLSSSLDGFLVTRTFELWAHSMDIALATGRPRPVLDPERMATLSARLMAVVPLALAYRRTVAQGRTARFVLTGPAGGAYSVPLSAGKPAAGRSSAGKPAADDGGADVLIVADAVDVCRVAARRLSPHELPATIEGDAALADLVLAGLDAFARD